MNLRCFYCQTPFTLGRAEILAALQQMDTENMNHYDAHCPRCRRANSISRQRLEMFMPNWREVAAEQAAMPPAPEEAPVRPAEEPVPAPATTMQMTESMPLAAAPKAHHARKRAGSAKKAAVKPAAKAASKTKKQVATRAKAKPATKPKTTTSSKSKKTTTKSKKK